MNLKVICKNILLKELPKERIKNGIIVPDGSMNSNQAECDVLAVGSSIKEVKVGDRVIVNRYSGTAVSKDKQDYIILQEDQILAIL